MSCKETYGNKLFFIKFFFMVQLLSAWDSIPLPTPPPLPTTTPSSPTQIYCCKTTINANCSGLVRVVVAVVIVMVIVMVVADGTDTIKTEDGGYNSGRERGRGRGVGEGKRKHFLKAYFLNVLSNLCSSNGFTKWFSSAWNE